MTIDFKNSEIDRLARELGELTCKDSADVVLAILRKHLKDERRKRDAGTTPQRTDACPTPIEQCDVEDKENLQEFRYKRTEWLDWLLGDDEHAVWRQISTMCWSYITFRVMNEALRIATKRDLPSPVRNGPMFEFATLGFVTTQALSIRRLEERGADKPERQVVSLRRLVEDIRKHRCLFTREVFVGYDGAPYDPEPGRQRYWQQHFKKPRIKDARGVVFWSENHLTTGPNAWQPAEDLHKIFDSLARISPTQRSRDDRIDSEVFYNLQKLVDEPVIKKVRQLANKRIAHSADVFSRSIAAHQLNGITFNDMDSAHRALIMAAGFIASMLLCETNLAPIPVPQFDVFEHLETSGLNEQDFARLRRLANALAERRERWAESTLEDLAQ